jgi:succinoglycan biosynthesis transport protein ExoP
LIRWWWLLVVATLVAAASSFIAVRQQPPIYQAHATLMIGRMIQDPNPNSGEFYLVQQLASTYADMGNREPIKNQTMQALGLTYLPDMYVQALPNSSLIAISVTDADPKRAQAVANELANQLILSSPSGDNPANDGREKFVNDQLDRLQAQIQDTSNQIDKLQLQLGDLTSARQIADMQTQIAAQQEKLTTLQSNYASLLASTQKGATNSLSLIEPAGLPVTPIGPKKLMTVGLASVIGFVLASLAAYGIEALDDTLKTAEEVSNMINAPILGYLGEIPEKNDKLTFVMEEPRSPISDSFRLLRTNLEFLGINQCLQVILVSSTDVSDGKSTIAMNLAISFAQNNKRTILVDADLRKPTINNTMEIQNQKGLSDLCLGNINIHDALIPWGDDHFKFIPAGSLPPNPVELLSSSKMSQIIEDLRRMADVVIIDSPPVFLADTVVLSGKVDGILLVVYPGHTHKKSVSKLRDQSQRFGANLIGVVLNRIPERNNYPGKYYSHYQK